MYVLIRPSWHSWFEPGAYLSRLPGCEHRPAQVELARAIADPSRHLMAEAPTGSGKSLAYQVPSIIRARLHDLRHTAATVMLLQGVNAKVVSERLGHASIAITLDIYAHVLPTMQDEAARAMERVLSGT